MGKAPTPVPHVPVMFLKAGGLSFFSDKCIELLAKAGYEADDFGSYDHVKDRLSAAREKCADPDKAKQGPPVGPTEREKELGKPMGHPDHYESGHLGMNTCMQGQRGKPCSNFVDGHNDGQYPCMPHQGSALDPGSEHNRWTAREVDARKSENAPPGAEARGEYPKDAMDKDADARTEALLKEREAKKQAAGTDVKTTSDTGKPTVGSVAEQMEAKKKANNNEPVKRMDEADRVQGETAADCINNFRKMGEAGMKKELEKQDVIDRNKKAAGTQAERDAAKAKAEASKKTADTAKAQHEQEQAAEKKTQADADAARKAAGNPATKAQADAIEKADAAHEAQKQKTAAAQANADATAEQASKDKGASSRMENSKCRAEQGERLRDGTDNEDGRYPKDWDDLPRQGTQQNSGQVNQE
jgi:hypothetical protein